MVVYFSGTGNSRYCAQMIAHKLDDELLDAGNYIKHQIAADLISGKPWVFVSPTYAWQLPKVFAQFIRTGSFSGCEDAYFVMTCGEDIGNAGEYIKALCKEANLRYRGVLPVVMPENYLAMFDVPGVEESAEIIAAAKPALNAAIAEIRQGSDFPEGKAGFADKLKSGKINTVFYKMFVKARGFSASNACVGCGKCAELCVLNNIRLKNGKPTWGGSCTHCMACICGCPKEAIEYGKKSQGKPRYRCKEYNA